MASLILILALLQSPAAGRQVEGTVLDAQGLPITGAHITLTERQGSARRAAVSTADKFKLDGLSAAIYDVRVEADGFDPQTVTADLRNQTSATVEIRMQPGRFSQEVIVAATRTEQRLGDIPASASIMSGEQIKESPALVADDVLRENPTFSLFRRTSSLASHPTSQGVSLRGIGPSGVSRTLVLIDDVPFNDPFGGWVYWTRVPLMSVDRIEMVDGTNSSVYGNYAMGGVINMVTSKPAKQTVIIKPQYGSRHSPKLDFFTSDAWDHFGMAVEGSGFDTDGYPVVAANERGLVDTKATVSYQNLNLKTDYTPSDKFSSFFRSGYFSEKRSNGKIMETNDTRWKFVSGGVRMRLPDQSDLQARVTGNFETFHSTFLAVPAATPARSIGRLTLLQKVPAKDAGGMVQWSKSLFGKHYFTAGSDWRWVRGDSREDGLDATTGTQVILNRVSGGTQKSEGFFLQDLVSLTRRLQLTLSARADHWKNYNAHNLETVTATGLPNANNKPSLPDKENTVGSPHVGLRYTVTDRVSVWSAVNWGFRAPTLNELYRQFRVGAILTLANDQLGPERLFGGEIGVNLAPAKNLTWRSTWFSNRLKSPIANVTLPSPPANTRQRKNLGSTLIWGIQNDVEYRFKSKWRFAGAYVYDMATVKEYPADLTLIGKLLPEVPKHRGSMQIAYMNPKYATVALDVQFSSLQFDDDQNTLLLPGYGVVNVSANHEISQHAEVFIGAQNLFNRGFLVMKAPTTLGAPRMVTGGIRLTWTGK